MATQVNEVIRLVRQGGGRLELHGDVIVVRDGTYVYAIGMIDNGNSKYMEPKWTRGDNGQS